MARSGAPTAHRSLRHLHSFCECVRGDACVCHIAAEVHTILYQHGIQLGNTTLDGARDTQYRYGRAMPDLALPNRIRELRDARGISAAALGALVGMSQPQVTRLEKGDRRLKYDQAAIIAQALGVAVTDLHAEIEGAPERAHHDSPRQLGQVRITEIEVHAGAGPERMPDLDPDGNAVVLAEWMMPREFLPSAYRGGNLVIVRVQGDSMMPRLAPNERVVVDTSQTVPFAEGIYLTWNGLGVVIKRLQVLPGNPAKVRISSDNPAYEPYIVTADEVRVFGRIIGRWEWW